MEEVIRKIISIENNAQDIMVDTEREKQRMKDELDERIRELDKSIYQKALAKIAQLRETELSFARSEADVIVSSCSSKLENIQKLYDENYNKWTDDLVNAVLKR